MANDANDANADTGSSTPDDDFDLPLTDAGGTGGAGAGGADTDGAAADHATTGDELPAELVEGFRREGLKLQPGETADQAYQRLTYHLSRKSANHYAELRRVREESSHAIKALTAQLEPMLRDYYRQQHQAEVEQIAAQIPDRETDPEGYQIWLQEEILRRDDESRREKETAEERQRRLNEEQRRINQLQAIDDRGYQKVAEGLGLAQGATADPEFATAFDVMSELAISAARDMFPNAPDELIEEFTALSQQQDIRLAESTGRDFRDILKNRLNTVIDRLVRAGLVTVAGAGDATNGNNGNARGAVTGVVAARKPGTAAGKPSATTAQRVSADAAAAARRSTSAVPSTTRAGGSSQLPDVSNMDEDEYVNAAMAQLLGTEEQRAMSAAVGRRGR